jgi:hypothetical protein
MLNFLRTALKKLSKNLILDGFRNRLEKKSSIIHLFVFVVYVSLRFMFRHEFLKVMMILTFYAHIYVFDADDELKIA